jgi:prepilin-type N-terminal cleavage/methylation domain-containing protein
MRRMKQSNNEGFTLIEILVVTVILSVVSLAIFTTFSNGIKIWKRINTEITGEDLFIFCDRFGFDLRNSFKFTGIKFLGKEDSLEFPTKVNSPRLNAKTVGRVSYEYNPDARILIRRQTDFSGVYSAEEVPPKQSLKDIKNAKFLYYFYDKEKKEYVWLEEWSRDELPLAVKMELEFAGQDKNNKFIRTFSIPAGG